MSVTAKELKEITQQLIKLIYKIVDYKYCKNYIKDFAKCENIKFTKNTWKEVKDTWSYNILDSLIHSNDFKQILNQYDITPQEYDLFLFRNLDVEHLLEKHINDRFISIDQFIAPLFVSEEQISKFKSTKEFLEAIKFTLQQLLTWEKCKKIVDTKKRGEDKYIALSITNLDDLEINALDILASYSNFLNDNNISFKELYDYWKRFNLKDKLDQYVNKIFKSKDQEKPLLYNKKIIRYDPYEFYLRKDKIGDEQYSKRSPCEFSSDRTSPVILINDEVYTSNQIDAHHFNLLDDFKKKHNLPEDFDMCVYATGIFEMPEDAENEYKVTNIAVGSNFNKVVLLEYYEGNLNEINATFLKHGFKKVYYNEDNAEITNTYKRIARLKK